MPYGTRFGLPVLFCSLIVHLVFYYRKGSVFVIPHQVGAVFLHGLHKAVCIIRLHKTGDYSIQCFSGKALSSSTSIKTLSTPCDDSYYQSYASYSHSQLYNALLCYLAHTDPLQSMPRDHHWFDSILRRKPPDTVAPLSLSYSYQTIYELQQQRYCFFQLQRFLSIFIFLPPWVPTTNAQKSFCLSIISLMK